METPQGTDNAVAERPPVTITMPVASVAPMVNPFERRQHDSLAAGAVAIESERAIAEAQGKLVIAQRFRRDQFAAFERMMDACKRVGLAKTAFYSYPRGGATVSGPSIRLAEELARCWGNVDYGLRELSNREGISEMEAYAWDMETNTISKQQFTVRHLRDRKAGNGGTAELTDQRDIYEITANMGARRLRARIMAILPDDFVDAAVQACRRTLADKEGKEPMPERIKRTLSTFREIGVTGKHIEEYLKHPLDATLPEELANLHGIYMSIKDGQSKASDWFGARIEQPQLTQPGEQQASTTAAATTTAATGAPAAPAGDAQQQPQARQSRARKPATPPTATTSPQAPAAAENAPKTDAMTSAVPKADQQSSNQAPAAAKAPGDLF